MSGARGCDEPTPAGLLFVVPADAVRGVGENARAVAGRGAHPRVGGGFVLKGRNTVTTMMSTPLEQLEQLLPAVTNDQALELAYAMLADLADRAERAADIAIDSDDRDAENEALVFADEVEDILPSSLFSSSPRLREAWHKARDAAKDVRTAIANSRQANGRGRSSVESFSARRNARVRSASEVQWRREQAQTEALVERANITAERVAAAIATLGPDGTFKALDVTLALMPDLRDTKIVGRQSVIARVSQEIQKLVKSGALVKHAAERAPDGFLRGSHSYTVAGDAC